MYLFPLTNQVLFEINQHISSGISLRKKMKSLVMCRTYHLAIQSTVS
jgi:hypothetical protein